MTATNRTVDVLIAGSGAAGLTAAVTARRAGLEVLVVDDAAEEDELLEVDGVGTA